MRAFPSVEFYFTLVFNEPDADRLRGLIARFHHFISSLPSDEADEALISLKGIEKRMAALALQEDAAVAPLPCPLPDDEVMPQIDEWLDVDALGT